ncbi:MAG: DegT/DnrJ/EryC1/StrS family aminotransferase [Abditibacteriota bacterium]|nr:DegT/DnrJ/EryC1/StrS family aminotransferase [Abditibacteriota bacterium]
MTKPAILGGSPVNDALPDFIRWPRPTEKIKEALLRTLASGNWGTLSKENSDFAKKWAEYTGAGYALPCLNGTIAIELALRGLGIGRGDEVITTGYTFTATVHSIVNAGAAPVFADIDPETFCIDPKSAEEKITPRTKAILGVHLGGRPFDADLLRDICKKRGLYLIEDCAHAHGSQWKGQKTGALGNAGCFSFQASKNISAGEGGAVTTNDRDLYERLWSMHHNGRAFGRLIYDHPVLSTDARLADWQCAALSAQLPYLDDQITARMEGAERLNSAFEKLPFLEPLAKDPRIERNSLHLFCFRYKPEGLNGLSREQFIEALAAENVCLPGTGYADPIYEMAMLYTDDFKKLTGEEFKKPCLPANDLIAHREGCWLYHSSLLGGQEGTDRILEAIDRIAKYSEELKNTEA